MDFDPPIERKRRQKALDDPRFSIKPLQQVTSACTGAIITACFMTPLDVIKTRMQAQTPYSHKCFLYCNGLMDHIFACSSKAHSTILSNSPTQFSNTLDAFVKISRNEGFSSLWSGLAPTLISALPSTIIYFVAYEQFRERYLRLYYEHWLTPRATDNLINESRNTPLFVPMMAGVTARVLAVTFVSPIELVRTKMQSERLTSAQIRSFVRNIVAAQGILGLWRGLPPTILRDVPFSGIYWPTYEYLKIYLSEFSQPSFGSNFLAGVIAGSVAALATTPFDVVKTREQIEFGEQVIFADSPRRQDALHGSTFARLRSIYRVQGFAGLFAGCGPRLLKVAPACAIMISTFEYGKSYFFYYNIQKYNQALQLSNPDAQLIKLDDIE